VIKDFKMSGRKLPGMASRGTTPNGTKAERRKAFRFPVSVPVEVSWSGPEGKAIKAPATARQVNGNGGILEMETYPDIGTRVSITNFLSAATSEARVLANPSSREGVSSGIVVELIVPNEAFWGVNFQIKKTVVELQKLETSLLAEGVDPRLLNEFREAVDFMRTTAQVVQQMRERQIHGREDDEATVMLIADRIQRTTNLCFELLTDMEAGALSSESKGVEDLSRSLDQTCERLRNLLKRRDPDRRLGTRI
jgi:hypothetical protein